MCNSNRIKAAGERKQNWKGMNWCSQHKRLAIYLRDGLACAYCGEGVATGAKLSLDHLTPDSMGGTNETTNLITCCSKCNSSRGDRPYTQFAKDVAKYINHGVTGAQIIAHIKSCIARPLDTKNAKLMVERAGSCKKVIETL